MDNYYYIESAQLNNFLNNLKRNYRVFHPAIKDLNAPERDYYYRSPSDGEPLIFNAYRCIEPLKSFFTPADEKVTTYFTADKNISEITEKTIIFGVKNCDISSHIIQDFVFLEGVEVDSLYRLRRENTLLISGDCTDFKKVCHCLAWDILPYPTGGFDLNLSPLNDGYVVEPGSKKGEELIQKYKEYFMPAKDTLVAGRKAKRETLIERLKKHLLPQSLVSKDTVQKLVKDGYSLDTWQKFMLPCVECGGCNLICDTCHCFLLADKPRTRALVRGKPGTRAQVQGKKEGQINSKLRLWDSCQYANFGRVAGGANPLKTRTKRLRNRFLKKFDFFVENLGRPACCGCGRCIEVCPGKIDIREVLKDLDNKLNKVASRE